MEEIQYNSKTIEEIEQEFQKELQNDLPLSMILNQVNFSHKEQHEPESYFDDFSQEKTSETPKRKSTIGDLLPKLKPIKKSGYKKSKELSGMNSSVSQNLQKKDQSTSLAFYKRKVCRKWNEEETEKFFTCLSIFGTDFSLISQAMPTRDRKEIKVG